MARRAVSVSTRDAGTGEIVEVLVSLPSRPAPRTTLSQPLASRSMVVQGRRARAIGWVDYASARGKVVAIPLGKSWIHLPRGARINRVRLESALADLAELVARRAYEKLEAGEEADASALPGRYVAACREVHGEASAEVFAGRPVYVCRVEAVGSGEAARVAARLATAVRKAVQRFLDLGAEAWWTVATCGEPVRGYRVSVDPVLARWSAAVEVEDLPGLRRVVRRLAGRRDTSAWVEDGGVLVVEREFGGVPRGIDVKRELRVLEEAVLAGVVR